MAVKWYGPSAGDKVRRGMNKGLLIAIGIVETRVIHLVLHTTKTGRKYARGSQKYHQASAPGEPFANDTGQTLSSRTIVLNPAAMKAALILRSENARRLEFGTRKMAPRPYARRALSETSQQIVDAIGREIRSELRRP